MTLFRTLLAGTGWVVALTAIAIAADKPKITSQDQLPRFSYPLKGKVTEIVTNDAAYAPLAAAVRADLEKLLATYEIADRTTSSPRVVLTSSCSCRPCSAMPTLPCAE